MFIAYSLILFDCSLIFFTFLFTFAWCKLAFSKHVGSTHQTNSSNFVFFFLKFLEDISPFRGATDTPVLASGDACPRFQSQGGSLFACFLKFTSGATPADCIEVSSSLTRFKLELESMNVTQLLGNV